MLAPVITAADGAVVLSLVVDATNTVTAIQLDNNYPGGQVTVTVTKASSGALVSNQTFGQGTFTQTLKKPQQWNYLDETADWNATLSMRF